MAHNDSNDFQVDVFHTGAGADLQNITFSYLPFYISTVT